MVEKSAKGSVRGFGSSQTLGFITWVQQAWVCFCVGSIGSISVWGPVAGRSHTVAPHGAMLPPDFSHFKSHDSSVCLSVYLSSTTAACSFPPPTCSFIIYSFFFSSSSPYLVLAHAWFVIIHSPPPVKRIRLAINARLDKAGTSRVREEGPTDPDSFVIG